MQSLPQETSCPPVKKHLGLVAAAATDASSSAAHPSPVSFDLPE